MIPQAASLNAEETTATKIIPALFPIPDVSASALAQAYLISYRSQFGV